MSDIAEYLTINENSVFDRLGESATYTPAGGAAVAITVLPSQPDLLQTLGETRISSTSTEFVIRTAEVATPAVGDTIIHGGITYTIKDVRREGARRRAWVVETRP